MKKKFRETIKENLMNKFIYKSLFYRVLFLTGDTLVLDRWMWLKKELNF